MYSIFGRRNLKTDKGNKNERSIPICKYINISECDMDLLFM